MDFEKFTEKSQRFIAEANQSAIKKSNQHVLPGHLLQVFIENAKVGNFEIFNDLEVNLRNLQSVNYSKLNEIPTVHGENINIFFSDGIIRILNQSINNLKTFDDTKVYPELILYSMLDSDEKSITQIFNKLL